MGWPHPDWVLLGSPVPDKSMVEAVSDANTPVTVNS